MRGFAGVGAAAKAELAPVGAAAAGAAGEMTAAERSARGLSGGLGAAGASAGTAGGAMRTAAKDTSTFGLGLGSAGSKVKEFTLAATKMGGVIGIVGLGAAFYEGTKKANAFEAEMAKLVTQAGVSDDQMLYLKESTLGLAGKIGSDPDSLAEALFHVESNFGSMGISSTKALSLVETAAKGARVGGADLVDVTNALTAAVAAQIPGVDNLDEAMGYLNATVGIGDMSMQNLADAFSTGAVAVVKGYGLSIKDVGAALAVFGDNNIRGATAGTQLRMVVQSLAVPAKTGKAALAALGLQQDTLAKDMQHGGLNEAITDLHTRLQKAGIGANETGNVLTQAFGKKAGTGLAILVSQFDRLQSKYPELEEGATKFGAAWDNTQKTTKQKIAELKGSFDALLINMGTASQGIQGKLAGAGASALQGLSRGAEAFGRSFQTRDVETDGGLGKVQQIAVAARAEVDRLGVTLGNAKKIVADLAPTFGRVAAAVGGGLIVGLHAFEGVINLAAQHTTLLKNALVTIGAIMIANKVATLALTAAHAAQNIVFVITDLRTSSMTVALGANSVAKTENLIGTRLLTAAYNSSLVTLVRTVVVWTAQKVAMVASAVATKAMAAGQWLLNAAMDANPIGLVVIAIAALVAGAILAYKHVGWFRDAVNATGRALESAWKWVAKVAAAFGHDLVSAFNSVGDAAQAVGRFFVRIYSDVVHWLGVAVDFVRKWWPVFAVVMTGGAALIPVLIFKYWRQIVSFTTSAFTDAKNLVVKIFKDIYNAVSSAVSAVLGFVGQHWRLLLVMIMGPIGLIIVLIVNAKDKIASVFQAMWNAVSGFAQRIWRDVTGYFTRLWQENVYIATRIWRDVAGFFSRTWSDVSGFASRLWRDVSGFFSRTWSDVSGFAMRIWRDVAGFFSRTYNDVSGFTSKLWRDVSGFFSRTYSDAAGFATRIWRDVAGFFSNLWRDASGFASRLWSDVAGFFSNLWRDTTGWASRTWHDVSGFFTNIWRDTTTTASNLWKDVTGWFEKIKNDITNSVKTATGWIKGAWDGLKEIFKAPINFMINTVYNNGIVPTWNFLADIVREPHLPTSRGLATGGRLPGYGGGDIIPAMLEPGEAVVPKHLVPEMAGWARKKGIPGFRDGGVAGGILGAIGDAVTNPLGTLEALGSGTLSVLGTAVHWVRGALADAVSAMLAPVRAAINGTLGTKNMDWKGAAGKLMTLPLDKIVDIARGQDKKDQADAAAASAAAPVGAAPVGDIQAYAMQLLTAHGWANQWNSFNALEMGEAGWNPAALNKSSGAFGLPQALPASKLDAYGNRNDYHVQLRWMMDYIAGRYGSPANAYSTWLGRSPHWYDQGGALRPGLTLAANGTGRDEWVVPKAAVTVAGRGRGGAMFAPGSIVQNNDFRGATDPDEIERRIHRANADLVATLDTLLQQGEGVTP